MTEWQISHSKHLVDEHELSSVVVVAVVVVLLLLLLLDNGTDDNLKN